MSKPFPLQTLLDLSQKRMDDATRRLGELLASEQEATTRLDLLQQYRDEYQNRFMDATKNGINRKEIDNYRIFLGRLDDAIGQARQIVEQTKWRTSQGQQDWLDKRGRVKAFDTLSQRHQTRQNHMENRKEQKLLDEHVTRQFQSTQSHDD